MRGEGVRGVVEVDHYSIIIITLYIIILSHLLTMVEYPLGIIQLPPPIIINRNVYIIVINHMFFSLLLNTTTVLKAA